VLLEDTTAQIPLVYFAQISILQNVVTKSQRLVKTKVLSVCPEPTDQLTLDVKLVNIMVKNAVLQELVETKTLDAPEDEKDMEMKLNVMTAVTTLMIVVHQWSQLVQLLE
jgi:hypothetical protein